MNYKLGTMIDHFRKARGMTMDELGERLGKTTSTVSRWINGSRSPKVEDLIRLTDIFNTDVNTMLYGDDALVQYGKYKYYADDLLSLNIEHFFNLEDDHFLMVPLPDFLFNGKPKSDHLIFTRLHDDSMDRVISPKSIIGIDTDPPKIVDGSIVICYYQNQIKIRRYFDLKKDHKIAFETDKKNLDNKRDVLSRKDVLILGRVVSVFSSLSV